MTEEYTIEEMAEELHDASEHLMEELGTAWANLIDIWGSCGPLSTEFCEEIEKEIKFQHRYLRENFYFQTRTVTTTHTTEELVYKDD